MINSPPRLIAHRGASLYLPENTLPAFKLAKAQGAKMFECDVQLSQDQVPIIFHDDTLERTTHGQGIVADMLLTDLKALAIKNTAKHPLALQNIDTFNIPTLRETLAWCLSHNMMLNLELKINTKATNKNLVQQVLAVIREFPVKLQELMLVSSFAWEKLTEFHQAAPEFAIALLVDQVNWRRYQLSGLQKISRALHAFSINVALNVISGPCSLKSARIQALKALAPYLLVYTVNEAKLAQGLFRAGVDAVFSDNPLLLV